MKGLRDDGTPLRPFLSSQARLPLHLWEAWGGAGQSPPGLVSSGGLPGAHRESSGETATGCQLSLPWPLPERAVSPQPIPLHPEWSPSPHPAPSFPGPLSTLVHLLAPLQSRPCEGGSVPVPVTEQSPKGEGCAPVSQGGAPRWTPRPVGPSVAADLPAEPVSGASGATGTGSRPGSS